MVTTRSSFDRQLCALQDHVQTLAQMVADSINNCIIALEKHDLELARRVHEHDAEINALRFQIEEEAYRILALQAPVSHDMRLIVATISVVTNLERIGDHAAGIARLVLRMKDHQDAVPVQDFEKMGQILKVMLEHTIAAYRNQDQPVAKAVVQQDAEIDQIHHDIYDKLIAQMRADPSSVETGTLSLWISHNMERIGDRCANIAERVNYLVTGELVKQKNLST